MDFHRRRLCVLGEKKGKPHPYRVVRGGSSGTNVPRGSLLHQLEDADYNSSGIGVRCARDGSPDAGTR